MNSDITRLYVEGVQQRHQRKEDAKWQSMQAKYLTEVLEENSYLPDDKDEFDNATLNLKLMAEIILKK